jgi:predicted Rossmann fold nucleotide-binding protein DprA/Smf involved in DNA uptake
LPVDAQPETRRIFNLLQERSLHIDEVIEASGFSTSRVSQILLELELQGFLKQLPGNRYSAEC